MNTIPTTDAQKAVHAVEVLIPNCGPYIARQYATKHKVLALYRLAKQLKATQHLINTDTFKDTFESHDAEAKAGYTAYRNDYQEVLIIY